MAKIIDNHVTPPQLSKSKWTKQFHRTFVRGLNVGERKVSALSHPLADVLDGQSGVSAPPEFVQSVQTAHSDRRMVHDPRDQLIVSFQENTGRWHPLDLLAHVFHGRRVIVAPVLVHDWRVTGLQRFDVNIFIVPWMFKYANFSLLSHDEFQFA